MSPASLLATVCSFFHVTAVAVAAAFFPDVKQIA